MDKEQFRHWSRKAADWGVDYRDKVADLPVRSPATFGQTLEALPPAPPEQAEDFATIFADFEKLVPGGLTHWQHPRFFAYFPANSLPASVVAEQLTAAIGAQCMLWQTSPVATEMEIRMLEWLAQMCQLPAGWKGVIQDTASTATMAALIAAREQALQGKGMSQGLAGQPALRFYCTENCHSSVDKAVRMIGAGTDNLVRIPTDAAGSMDPDALAKAVDEDRRNGMLPAGVVLVVGATTTGVSDDLARLCAYTSEQGIFCHVDAAWAGSAMICPEHRGLLAGLELADSYVFNPHKWLGANFDVSAHYLKDAGKLVDVMSASPSYLRTTHAAEAVDFSSWSPQLGRRFRALKLWFIIRCHGIDGLRQMIRDHISWAGQAAEALQREAGFELVCEPQLALFVFRHQPAGLADPDQLDEHNQRLLEAINADGFLYLTPARPGGRNALRFQVGNASTREKDVQDSVGRIIQLARGLGSDAAK